MKTFIVRYTSRYIDEKLLQLSGSLAYTTLLTIVPMLIVFTVVGAKYDLVLSILDALKPVIADNFLPKAVKDDLYGYISGFVHNVSGLTYSGLIILFCAGLLLCNEIETAVLHIWGSKPRNLAARFISYALFICLGPLTVGLSILVFLYIQSYSVKYIQEIPWSLTILNILLLKSVMIFMFYTLYAYLPGVRVYKLQAFVCAALVSVIISIMQYGFKLFLAHAHTYNLIYGTFYLVPVFLLWLYLIWCVILGGALLHHLMHINRTQMSTH